VRTFASCCEYPSAFVSSGGHGLSTAAGSLHLPDAPIEVLVIES